MLYHCINEHIYVREVIPHVIWSDSLRQLYPNIRLPNSSLQKHLRRNEMFLINPSIHLMAKLNHSPAIQHVAFALFLGKRAVHLTLGHISQMSQVMRERTVSCKHSGPSIYSIGIGFMCVLEGLHILLSKTHCMLTHFKPGAHLRFFSSHFVLPRPTLGVFKIKVNINYDIIMYG